MALDSQLRKMGFAQSKSDPCIYTSGEDNVIFIGVYVDDLVLAGNDKAKIKRVKKGLSERLDQKDLCNLNYFLGMSVVQNPERKETWMGQPAYIQRLLIRMGMENCKPVKTPSDTGNRLVKATEDKSAVMYLANCTRPDIAYAVGTLARFSSKPNQTHWVAAKRVLCYLKGTSDLGIIFQGGEPGNCVGYSDADWAGDREDRKSTSGYMFQIAVDLKKQDTVALSTAEAEYVALSSAAQKCVWMRRLNSELGNPRWTYHHSGA